MKPFLILQLRPLNEASDNEFEAFLKYGELKVDEVHRVRMEQQSIPEINLDDYSGIILGGGPSNISDSKEEKENYQKQFEADLNKLLDRIFKEDFPFLGVCYGIGALNYHQGGKVSKEKFSEDVGAVEIELTESGRKDELLSGLPSKFEAYVGHKEACLTIPENAKLLARSSTCPFQMIKFKQHIYATQFHTELDETGILLRIKVYKHHGYFSPVDAQMLIEKAKEFHVEYPSLILNNFVKKYRRK